MRKFWNFSEDDGGEGVLRLEGEIASESWWGDEVTPKMFMTELASYAGKNITVFINSPGGDVVAGSQIYTALKEHSGTVTVKVDGLAASAASVIAMAGDFVYMSPPSLMMIHDPATIAWGTTEDMQQAIVVLNECKEAIINAYAIKTGLSRAKIARLMSDETWMNAKKAVELGFADKVLYSGDAQESTTNLAEAFLFGRRSSQYPSLIAFAALLAPKVSTLRDCSSSQKVSDFSGTLKSNSLLARLPKTEPPPTDDNSEPRFAGEITAYKNQFEII